jgi:ribulose-5-phosphate 4-epimerase/fuculose-1-phosphate aldolase
VNLWECNKWQLKGTTPAAGRRLRLAALFGWEDTLYTHFSVRLPGDGEPRFLINPFGMMFDEVTASNLIVVDMQGKVVEGSAGKLGGLYHPQRGAYGGKTPTA